MQKFKALVFFTFILTLFITTGFSQSGKLTWMADGESYSVFKDGNIVRVDPKNNKETIVVGKAQLTPAGSSGPLKIQSFAYSPDGSKILLFTNTQKVWRYKTRGDYWVIHNNSLRQVGKNLPKQSLMFAKFSPDSKHIGFVSEHNIFVEGVDNGIVRKLTTDGTDKLINGTFDWAYEEEFGCRDGFRWSPDSRQIAFWQVDASQIKEYYMLNTTASNYSEIIPVQYPKVGESPSPVKIGVLSVNGKIGRAHV